MLTAKDQLTENWQYAAIGVAAVVLIVAASVYYFSSRTTANLEVAEKLATAQMDFRSGNTQVAIMSLTQIADEAGGATARQAMYLLGKVNFDSKNYPEAIRYWEQFLTKYSDDPFMKSAALGGIATCYENQGQFDQAAVKYAEAVDADKTGPSAAEYLFGAMRCNLQNGDKAKAQANLDQIRSDWPGTSLETRALRYHAEKDPTASGS
jgi:TolA-binding protein